MSINPEDLRKKGRRRELSAAKGLIAYWGYKELGINGNNLAGFLKISRPAISKALIRGEKYTRERRLKLIS